MTQIQSFASSGAGIAEFRFGTKAETLDALRVALGNAVFANREDIIVLEQEHFTVSEWSGDRDEIVKSILGRFGSSRLVVRSSSRSEDTSTISMAGAFESLIDVAPTPETLTSAVDRVIASFSTALNVAPTLDDQVLVQPMASDIAVSGVVFSREINTGADYCVVDYDDFSGRTDTVTSGKVSKLFFVRRGHLESVRSHRFHKLIELVSRLEAICGLEALDLEFGIDSAERIYIFQLRPLTVRERWDPNERRQFHEMADAVQARIGARQDSTDPSLFGVRTLFGDMPDWNPAEILGNAPAPLSLSLYRHLVTDGIWARARAEMGYRDLSDFALLEEFGGRGFIDVQRSLNSFLPRDIDPDFGRRLVDYQVERLAKNRHWHDKIEFEIAVTCTDFSTHRRLDGWVEDGHDRESVERFGELVLALTRRQLVGGAANLDAILSRQDDESLDQSDATGKTATNLLDLLVGLDRIGEQGTLPFSILARHGFIGISFLKSMVTEGMLTQDRADSFMRSIRTVTSEFVDDLQAISTGKMDRGQFLTRYGHLRPGTYDIRSPRYDEAPELYLSGAQAAAASHVPFALSDKEEASIRKGLRRLGIDVMPRALMSYIERAVQYRELSKFRFTRHLSLFLSGLKRWGESVGLDPETLAYLRIEDLRAVAEQNAEVADLPLKADHRRDAHRICRMIRLPSLILSADDVNVVRFPMGRPTFITDARVTAPIKLLASGDVPKLDGHIVMIESADPGFDWIFSHAIEGLVTKYGGANSHMAIRCAEFGIPAAIGCGDVLFDELATGGVVELDCIGNLVQKVTR